MFSENELSNIIIGESIYVHKKLGPGLLESVYANCLTYVLEKKGLQVITQKPIPVVFDEVRLDCGYRLDMLVENRVIVEIKSVESLNDVHKAQLLTYLKLTNIKLGILINFNVLFLKEGIKRIVNNL